jgi:hypothetical protein
MVAHYIMGPRGATASDRRSRSAAFSQHSLSNVAISFQGEYRFRLVMRCWQFVFAIVIASGLSNEVTRAQVTAYAALRTLGSAKGEKALSQILSVSSEGTTSQPDHWKVCLDDPAARGGVRELEISGNQITSERTPVRSEWAGGRDMDLTQLNLDSDGAYQMADQEALKKAINFSAVHYQLAIDSQTGRPGWTLQLLDTGNQRLGAVKIDADSGGLVSTNWGQQVPNAVVDRRAEANQDERFLDSPDSQPPVRHYPNSQPTVRQYPDNGPGGGVAVARTGPDQDNQNPRYSEPQEEPDNSAPDSGSPSLNDRAHRYAAGAENFGLKVVHRIERPFLRAGGWIQKKVTGRDTISPPTDGRSDDDEDDDNDNNNNNSRDQYSRPVHPVPE